MPIIPFIIMGFIGMPIMFIIMGFIGMLIIGFIMPFVGICIAGIIVFASFAVKSVVSFARP